MAVSLDDLHLGVLDDLFAEGEKYMATIEAEKSKHKKTAQGEAAAPGKKQRTAGG